jgi:flagellar protein FlgJ
LNVLPNSMALDGVTNATSQLAVDANSLSQLNLLARQNPNQALTGAAQQFEAMFISMLMKSMRDATPQDGIFDSEQTKMFQSMLDQQLAQTMAKRGIGLAAVMIKQLSPGGSQDPAGAAIRGTGTGSGGFTPGLVAPAASEPAGAPGTADPTNTQDFPAPAAPQAANTSSLRDFADRMWPHAMNASQATGIPAHFMLGQAALETGWGRHQIRHADGSPSYNLFGVKAGRNWNGPTVSAVTTEYVNGAAVKTAQNFRAYGSYAESFRDYAKLLQNNPRYAAVLQNTSDAANFAKSLQHAGYATDPQYAQKLARIINSNVLRQSLSA